MTLLFSMKFLSETRVVLLLSMDKVCATPVSVKINLKLQPDFLLLLKTSNQYFGMSNGYLSSEQGCSLLGINF